MTCYLKLKLVCCYEPSINKSPLKIKQNQKKKKKKKPKAGKETNNKARHQ